MIGLNRALAPISRAAWEAVEKDAREVLALHLAGRKLVDFEGPLGWEHSAVDLGRVDPLDGSPIPSGAVALRRRVRPLIELRVPFELERRELDGIDRGAAGVDLDPLRDAARCFAAAEDTVLFQGFPDADIPGIVTAAEHEPVELPTEGVQLPDAVSRALEPLRQAGVGGPYIALLGPEAYGELDRSAGDGGYPVMRHVERLLGGPVVWAPSLEGGLVASLRGGDFKMTCGRDVSVGYLSHDEQRVRLYLEESFSAEVNGPEAVVPLRPR